MTKIPLKTILSLTGILFCMLLCADMSHAQKKEMGGVPQVAKEAAPGTATQAPPDGDPTEKEKKEEKYVYSPAGKTDPFESFLQKATAGARATSLSVRDAELNEFEAITSKGEPETELERIELSKLTLTSIIKGEKEMWAMVIDPKGRGYFIKKGTKIGTQSGFVDDIVSEQRQTDFGMETVKKVVVKIPYRDREKNIIYRSIEMEMPSVSAM